MLMTKPSAECHHFTGQWSQLVTEKPSPIHIAVQNRSVVSGCSGESPHCLTVVVVIAAEKI